MYKVYSPCSVQNHANAMNAQEKQQFYHIRSLHLPQLLDLTLLSERCILCVLQVSNDEEIIILQIYTHAHAGTYCTSPDWMKANMKEGHSVTLTWMLLFYFDFLFLILHFEAAS